MREEDLTYYRRRAAIEAERARNARCLAAVAAHQELAAMYAARAEGRAGPGSPVHG